jgi:hypothetical protein
MISKKDHGESMNWVVIMYFQLVKKLIRWYKCQKNMVEGIAKKEPKKDLCHFNIILEVYFRNGFLSKEQNHRRRRSRGNSHRRRRA